MEFLPLLLTLVYCLSQSFVNGSWFDEDTVQLEEKRATVSTCKDGYEKIPDHTMCLEDGPLFVTGTDTKVSDADIAVILERHNTHRAGVSPAASSMQKMYWDEELARTAEKWAKQCLIGHERDFGKSRKIPAYGLTPGQNGAMGWKNWAEAVDDWNSEVDIYQYGVEPKTYLKPGEMIGHYTQEVHDNSILVGCGFAKCNTLYKRHYYCNYLVARPSSKIPYASGDSCSGCPGKCVSNKLCDCGGKFCFNGGTMDIETCSCKCPSGYSGDECLTSPCPGAICLNDGVLRVSDCKCRCPTLYTGDSCQTESCPAKDPSSCGPNGFYKPAMCTVYRNVPAVCPIMCGKC